MLINLLKKRSRILPTINIIFDGDSHTDLHIYPPLLVENLRNAGYTVSYSMIGVGGRTSTQMLANVQNVINGHNPMYDINLCVFWIGTNDVFFGVNQLQTDINLKAYYNTIKDKFKVLQIGTTDVVADTANALQSLNFMFIRNWEEFYSDNFVNLLDDARYQNASNTTYFYDGTHMTTLGYQGVADLAFPKCIEIINSI